MRPLLTARNSESFRGCNDLRLATNGDIDVIDQGQTGHDPPGGSILGHIFVFAPSHPRHRELIAPVRSCAGPACTNVAIGGKSRNRLYIVESTTGAVLVADISALGQGKM